MKLEPIINRAKRFGGAFQKEFDIGGETMGEAFRKGKEAKGQIKEGTDFEENFDEDKNFTRNQRVLKEQYNEFRKQHPDMNFNDELHWMLVDLIDYDWYNNEGGQGEVVWDLDKEEFLHLLKQIFQ